MALRANADPVVALTAVAHSCAAGKSLAPARARRWEIDRLAAELRARGGSLCLAALAELLVAAARLPEGAPSEGHIYMAVKHAYDAYLKEPAPPKIKYTGGALRDERGRL